MTLSAFVNLFVRATFLLLSLLALRDLLRHRDQTRLAIAAMFASLAITIMAGRIPAPNAQAQRFIQVVIVLALISHPYLLLRLVSTFRPVSRLVGWLAAAGLAILWLLVIVIRPPVPQAVVLALIAYFVLVEVYAAAALLQGARLTAGVSRWRLGLISAGTLMLPAAIILLRVQSAAPSLATIGQLLFDALVVLAAIFYYLGFAPPRWLRRAWQLGELHRFLRQSAGRSIRQDLAEALTNVTQAASRSVAAMGAVVLLGEKTSRRLSLAAQDGLAVRFEQLTLLEDGAAVRAWYLQQPDLARSRDDFGFAEAAELSATIDARSLFAVPIATASHTPGLLLVFLRNVPLFAEDDLAMLALFAEQSAITLDNISLLAEQRELVDKLVQNEARLEELVEVRTAALSATNKRLQEEAAERRRVAHALHELNEELEQRVRERTNQLEVANKELESFAYSVSHDLRAPLRAIDGFSQALLEDCAGQIDSLGQDYLARVRANTQRMGELIDSLLKLSRMSRTAMQVEEVDLSALANNIINELQKRDEQRDVEVTITPGLVAEGDARLLRIVLWNLLENAWKFTGKQDTAQIEFGATIHDGQRAYFVRDDGAGFDMAYAEKLFGAFQRLHAMGDYSGTGIGLATVQRVIHRHQGRVWAQSKPGQGATFFFTLAADGENHGE